MSLMGQGRISLIVLIFLLLSVSGCGGPEPTSVAYEEIDTSGEPAQTDWNSGAPIPIGVKDGVFSAQPVAGYRVAAKVVGRESYFSGWPGKIVPMDLVLAWGKLAEPENEEFVTYRQGGRWYFFEVATDSPFTISYISNHSSNNHIVPATENIRRAVKSIKVKQKVVLEGSLVNLTGTYEGQRVRWNSSLSRTDAGDHSCELFYVTKVRIGNFIYE